MAGSPRLTPSARESSNRPPTMLTKDPVISLRQKSVTKFLAPEPGRMLLRFLSPMQEFSFKHQKNLLTDFPSDVLVPGIPTPVLPGKIRRNLTEGSGSR